MNDDFCIKNEPNKIHIPPCLYVPKECRNTLKQIFYGRIFSLRKKWCMFGEIRGFLARNHPKRDYKITFI